MSELYQAVFDEFKSELEKWMEEIFLAPLPFTQVNRLAMLAATVAERVCIGRQLAALEKALIEMIAMGNRANWEAQTQEYVDAINGLRAAIAEVKGTEAGGGE